MSIPEHRFRASDAERDSTLSILEQAHVEGRLDVDELRSRQSLALSAKYREELLELTVDLPSGTGLTMPQPQPLTTAEDLISDGLADYRQFPAAGALVDADPPPHFAIMSGRDISLTPGQQSFQSFAFWGGDDLDVSPAMGPGCTVVLSMSAIMGGSTIRVPEGVQVVDESVAIMAGNTIKRSARGDGSNGVLILRGFLFWGGNIVKLAK